MSASTEALGGDDPLPEQVYLDAVRRHPDIQVNAFEILDHRSVQIFSVGSAALLLTMALLTIGFGTLDVPQPAIWALFCGLCAQALLLPCVIRAGRVRSLVHRPDIGTLRSHSEDVNGAVLVRWIANEYHASTELNGRSLARKRRWVSNATFML